MLNASPPFSQSFFFSLSRGRYGDVTSGINKKAPSRSGCGVEIRFNAMQCSRVLQTSIRYGSWSKEKKSWGKKPRALESQTQTNLISQAPRYTVYSPHIRYTGVVRTSEWAGHWTEWWTCCQVRCRRPRSGTALSLTAPLGLNLPCCSNLETGDPEIPRHCRNAKIKTVLTLTDKKKCLASLKICSMNTKYSSFHFREH